MAWDTSLFSTFLTQCLSPQLLEESILVGHTCAKGFMGTPMDTLIPPAHSRGEAVLGALPSGYRRGKMLSARDAEHQKPFTGLGRGLSARWQPKAHQAGPRGWGR